MGVRSPYPLAKLFPNIYFFVIKIREERDLNTRSFLYLLKPFSLDKKILCVQIWGDL